MEQNRLHFRQSKFFRPLMIVVGILAAVLVFLLVFYVPSSHAEVVGSTRYADAEIRRMVFKNFADHNSVYLSFMKKEVQPEDAPFVSRIDIVYKSPSHVTLQVTENNPIGYVEQQGKDYYFDRNGVVLEAIAVEGWTPEEETESVNGDSSSISSSVSSSSASDTETKGTPLIDLNGDGIYDTTQDGIYLIDTDGDGYPDQSTYGEKLIDTDGDGIPDATPYVPTPTPTEEPVESVSASSSSTEGTEAEEDTEAVSSSSSGALQAVMETSSDTEFHPALTDVPMIKGLTEESLSVGQKIKVSDDTVFSSIQAVSKIISKLDIMPDSIGLDESYNMTLYYGDITVRIGGDNLLEEKMSRVAAILPQLKGLKGTLHLENFSEDTVNIVFDKE